MALRSVLVALVLAATAAFVIGVAVERSSGEANHHDAPPAAASGSEGTSEAGGETAGEHANVTSEGTTAGGETRAELRPLGIDVEAWPFVALAALASVGLAAGAWLQPGSAPLLGVVALAMLVFAALDAREVFHQADIDENALAVLAGVVAALHATAAVVAAAMASRARHPETAAPGPPGTMPA
jgi:disulfide bond formation protein DsbB